MGSEGRVGLGALVVRSRDVRGDGLAAGISSEASSFGGIWPSPPSLLAANGSLVATQDRRRPADTSHWSIIVGVLSAAARETKVRGAGLKAGTGRD